MALILWDRIGKIGSTTGEAQEANIEFVKVIGNLLDHSAQQRNADKANSLKNYTSNPTADATAITKAQTDIFAIYNCP